MVLPPWSDVDPQRLAVARWASALKDPVEREWARRQRIRSFRSNLLPGDKFAPLLQPAPYKVYYGGRDARKSWSFAEALVRRMNTEHGLRVLCTRMYQNSIRDSVHRVLADTIYRLGLEHRFHVTKAEVSCPATGGEFLFKGLQKPAELKSTEGCKIAWVAEAQDVDEDAWLNLEPTIRAEDSEIWVEFNTTSEDTPTWQRFVKNPPPGSIVRKVGYEDNPYLSNRSIAKIEHMKRTDHDAYLHIYGGFPKKYSEARVFGGKVRFESFSDDLWREAIRKGGRIFLGLDYGFAQDPMALVRYFIIDNRLYIDEEAFGLGVDFAGEMIHGDPRGEMERFMDQVTDVRDWPIKADSSRPETTSFLCNKGFNVSSAAKWEGCVEDGIAHIRGFDEIVIPPRCPEMRQEAILYSFKVDRVTKQVLPIVVDAWNHGWDAVRYGLDGYIQHRGAFETFAALAPE